MHLSAIDSAIRSRKSARAFSQQEVPRSRMVALLDEAARMAALGAKVAWSVHVLHGDSRQALCAKVCAAHDALRQAPELSSLYREPYDYYPEKWTSPYLERRRENGWSLYGLLGIGKADRDKMHAQHQRNYQFFDAPVGLIFTLPRALGRGELLALGAFVQSLMLCARQAGMHTCPQAAWNGFSSIVMSHIGAADGDMMVCAMALGFENESDTVNTFHTPRVPVLDFTRWLA